MSVGTVFWSDSRAGGAHYLVPKESIEGFQDGDTCRSLADLAGNPVGEAGVRGLPHERERPLDDFVGNHFERKLFQLHEQRIGIQKQRSGMLAAGLGKPGSERYRVLY